MGSLQWSTTKNRLYHIGISPTVCIGIRLFVLLARRSSDVSRCFGRYEGGSFHRQTVLLAPSPARPRPAAPPCAPTQPAYGRQVQNLNIQRFALIIVFDF